MPSLPIVGGASPTTKSSRFSAPWCKKNSFEPDVIVFVDDNSDNLYSVAAYDKLPFERRIAIWLKPKTQTCRYSKPLNGERTTRQVQEEFAY